MESSWPQGRCLDCGRARHAQYTFLSDLQEIWLVTRRAATKQIEVTRRDNLLTRGQATECCPKQPENVTETAHMVPDLDVSQAGSHSHTSRASELVVCRKTHLRVVGDKVAAGFVGVWVLGEDVAAGPLVGLRRWQ